MRKIQTALILATVLSAAPSFAQMAGSVPKPTPPDTDRPFNMDHPRNLPDTPTHQTAPYQVERPLNLPHDPVTEQREERFRQDVRNDERDRAHQAAEQKREFITDFGRFGLSPPPPNAMWLREGSDAVLLDQKTGKVLAKRHAVFKNGTTTRPLNTLPQ
ncbi:Ni/Co efflux regulator RcnB [Rhizomicrobium palustre]|uniref:Ni/Co efflux regulator RcnB n=1 Tax=Rhizomicrobium palustre TaxID=189966 RepID=A0A846MVA8_9PROT|nr:RcnB family protein [Rhizomicrobium palustre]NIK87468.1 Ni/Co efflux regulator RcnB [Rhizomicrobium palustre]